MKALAFKKKKERKKWENFKEKVKTRLSFTWNM